MLYEGIVCFESSVGGMGGCLFVFYVVGNVCMEDMVYMFYEMGIEIGLDFMCLMEVVWLVE